MVSPQTRECVLIERLLQQQIMKTRNEYYGLGRGSGHSTACINLRQVKHIIFKSLKYKNVSAAVLPKYLVLWIIKLNRSEGGFIECYMRQVDLC